MGNRITVRDLSAHTIIFFSFFADDKILVINDGFQIPEKKERDHLLFFTFSSKRTKKYQKYLLNLYIDMNT